MDRAAAAFHGGDFGAEKSEDCGSLLWASDCEQGVGGEGGEE